MTEATDSNGADWMGPHRREKMSGREQLKACPAWDAGNRPADMARSVDGYDVLRDRVVDMQDACAECRLRRPQPDPDVERVVEALKQCMTALDMTAWRTEGESDDEMCRTAHEEGHNALAALDQQKGEYNTGKDASNEV